MTKEELINKFNDQHGTIRWSGGYVQGHLETFFDSNVVIPKGTNRHPSSDILHKAIEGIKIQGWNHIRNEWEDDTSWFIDKNDLDYPTKYRIKPCEPVYEYQYAHDNGFGKAIIGDNYYTDCEFIKLNVDKDYCVKLEWTKRERR